MALNEITAIMPIKTTGVSSKIIFITKALKMIDATDDEYIEVTLRPFKSKTPEEQASLLATKCNDEVIARDEEIEEDEERTEE